MVHLELAATVAETGAILLGSNYAVDGFYKRIVRVVTHAHRDHLLGLGRSARFSIHVIATPTTFEFMRVLGYKVPEEKALPLPYNTPIEIDDETIILLPARHIAGSSQVLVDTGDLRVGYTGDFKVPGTPPMKDLDVLVLDATYGLPGLQRRWTDYDALSALITLIDRYIARGPVWIYGFHGKLQEVMVELRRRGVEYEFMADPVTIELAKIASRFYRVPIGNVRPYTGGIVNDSVVVFLHESRRTSKRGLPGVHVRLTGWEIRDVIWKTGPNSFNVSFSDHARLEEIIEYLEEARPRTVVVDAYRGRRGAGVTAKYIERMLGVPALTAPPRGNGLG